ncbi:metal ABC transporter solute-binding protein, Zn/Mn family [Roseomonas sp. CCTCC AB2023176]|uniref:metal ABC transporter solute-binding protein, Zn/Mn family n=1 Tax=Roseomonas sp. CCTCC AB2023176 TaxID=3342640 RepID=UPI0035DA6AA7
MQRRTLLLAPAAGLALPALVRGQGLPAVVASFSILGDVVRQVAGERPLALQVLVGPDADAHEFQPRPSDVERLRGAALLVRNGLGFDGWMDRLVRASGSGATLVTATEGVTPRVMQAGHSHSPGSGARRRQAQAAAPSRTPDPHAWGDPRNAATYARNVAAGLAAADPGNAALYRGNAEAYAARLATLHEEVRAAVAAVPEARRVVVTSHDAFGYYGDAYGIRFLAPQGPSTGGEASAGEVAALIRQIRAEGITAVFVENMSAPATLERLAREAGVRVSGRLYADALSGAGGPATTYEALVRHNTGLMVAAMLRGAA